MKRYKDNTELDMPVENIMNEVEKIILEHNLDHKAWYSISSKLDERVRCVIKCTDGYEPKEYVGKVFAKMAYGYILDNGGTREDALEFAREAEQKSEQWLDEVKNKRYFYTKDVVAAFDHHAQQKLMLENNTMDKSALKQEQSINQQIGRLAKYREISDTLENLKETDERQQTELDILNITVTTHEEELEMLREVNNLKRMPPKERAKRLKDKGFTQKQIADHLGKDVRTIRRWWKDL